VVAIVGLLAALAIYGVRKYMTNAKTTEARNALGQISKGAQISWDRELTAAEDLEPGAKSEESGRKLCPDAPAVPTDTNFPKGGEKYQSAEGDWQGEGNEGWECLRFSMRGPQYYQYEYTHEGDTTSTGFEAIARGDLDGDDETSEFKIVGMVREDGTLTVSTSIQEKNPDE